MARAGHDVHVIVPGAHRSYHREVINGVNVHTMPSLNIGILHPEAYLALFPQPTIRRIFQNEPPDIIHIQDHYFLSRDVAIVAKRMHIPILGTNHFLPENLLPYLHPIPLPRKVKIDVLWNLMLWTYNTLALVTTPTETAARILRGQRIKTPVVPVSCGVDTHYYHPQPEFVRRNTQAKYKLDPEKVTFLYVGRQDREKRIDLLLRGLAILRGQGRADIQVAIGGQGAARKELEALAEKLELNDLVHFLGYVPADDLPGLYLAADIFAMPSAEELQSIATLEAMASGKPILAANARALPELVTDGVNGRLFEPANAEAAAKAMALLADGRKDWLKMGVASRSRAMAHSLENTIRRYEALYRKVGGKRAGRAGSSSKMKLRAAGME